MGALNPGPFLDLAGSLPGFAPAQTAVLRSDQASEFGMPSGWEGYKVIRLSREEVRTQEYADGVVVSTDYEYADEYVEVDRVRLSLAEAVRDFSGDQGLQEDNVEVYDNNVSLDDFDEEFGQEHIGNARSTYHAEIKRVDGAPFSPRERAYLAEVLGNSYSPGAQERVNRAVARAEREHQEVVASWGPTPTGAEVAASNPDDLRRLMGRTKWAPGVIATSSYAYIYGTAYMTQGRRGARVQDHPWKCSVAVSPPQPMEDAESWEFDFTDPEVWRNATRYRVEVDNSGCGAGPGGEYHLAGERKHSAYFSSPESAVRGAKTLLRDCIRRCAPQGDPEVYRRWEGAIPGARMLPPSTSRRPR